MFFLFLIVVFLTACKKQQEPERSGQPGTKPPAYGEILVRGDIGDASNLIPILASDSASHNIAAMIYNGLVKYDKNMSIVSDLAGIVEYIAKRSGHNISSAQRSQMA